jgi:quaternary ammonium compound-resistance protein SugE
MVQGRWTPERRKSTEQRRRSLAWLWLFLAGLLEVAWAVGLKETQGWTRLLPSVFTLVTMAFSFLFLSLALRALPIGTAYAVWTGIGAVGTALYGIAFLGEPRDAGRILCLMMILAGIVGLKVLSSR